MLCWVFGVVGSFRDVSLPAPKRAVIWLHSLFLCLPPSPVRHIVQLSPLWWEIISDWGQPLALLQWSVKYCSINHLWLLKKPDSWPLEIVGWQQRGERGGMNDRGDKGSGVLAYCIVKPCSISMAALCAWPDHHSTWFLGPFYLLQKLQSRQEV